MVEITFEFDAFSFDGICRTVPLTLCPIIGRDEGIVPVCYSRNVELADNLIFQPGNKKKEQLYIYRIQLWNPYFIFYNSPLKDM